ncbi:MAG: LuxR C-terminal-related transcriptional regulator [Treponema sp.]|nr:LuxR C-terminal-related transcriptional regulator [Treponema sp.]
MLKRNNVPDESFHFRRPRVNKILTEAVKYPLVTICAGSGYGKTSAVADFTEENNITAIWIHLSERDNMGVRFWENCAASIAPVNKPFAEAAVKLGFPDTQEKLKQCAELMHNNVMMKQRVLIFDDFHFLKEPSVIRFLEECILHNMPAGTSVFLLSRSSPHLNIASLVSKGFIYNITENDLRFTENELARYFNSMNISVKEDDLREIIADTEGWAFAINLIVRSYQKAPGYSGYVRNAMKTNIFRLMETEIWDGISKPLQIFLIRLSLIEHKTFDLINLLAAQDIRLINELEKQNAYIRRDSYINAYLIHPLFLEFLGEKNVSLNEDQIRQTYIIAGEWCNKNSFKIDALSYFEKIGDYKSIISILIDQPAIMPRDIAKFAAVILDNAPQHAIDTVEYLATMHVSVYICLGLWEKSISLARSYEQRFLKLPENNHFRNLTLSVLYYSLGYLRILLCITDDIYDFDIYFEKASHYRLQPVDMKTMYNHGPGPWIICAGSSRKGSPEEYINSLKRTTAIICQCYNGLKTGEDELAQGELYFYKGDLHNAEILIIRGVEEARENNQFEILHRCLFYILRLGIMQGNYQKTQQAINEMKAQLKEDDYKNRYKNYDITMCWYNCIMGYPENVPDWLTDEFLPYDHASYIENFANQMKALYCYTTRNYPPVLSYIGDMKTRESYLFGRTEMLALEACIYYKMKDKKKAASALKEAYKTASPNELLMPFIELGKDMRTLSAFALREQTGIPKSWLENVNRKSASYAKRQGHVIAKYKQENSITGIDISPREAEILNDLSHGLSRSQIAANRNLSINTVKMVINNIYMKLGAENLADAIRIAAERKIL